MCSLDEHDLTPCRNGRDEQPPHGDLPKISIGHRQENEAHDGSVHWYVGVLLSHHLISHHRLYTRKSQKGEGATPPRASRSRLYFTMQLLKQDQESNK